VLLADQVDPSGLGHADKVHAAVLEEAAVFDSEDGIDHDFRNVGVFHDLALGARPGVEERGDELRFEFVSGEIVAFADDAFDFAVFDFDAGGFGAVVAFRAGGDFDSAFHHFEATQRRLSVFLFFLGQVGVAGAAQ